MNNGILNEINELFLKSNKLYLDEFMKYCEKSNAYPEIKKLYANFVKGAELSTVSEKKESQCIHIFRRGNNIGKQCTVMVKDNNQYCSKHKKVVESETPTEPITESTLKIDLNAVLSEEEDTIDSDIECIVETDEENPENCVKCEDVEVKESENEEDEETFSEDVEEEEDWSDAESENDYI
jgi:hypothetical protein